MHVLYQPTSFPLDKSKFYLSVNTPKGGKHFKNQLAYTNKLTTESKDQNLRRKSVYFFNRYIYCIDPTLFKS